MNHHKNKKTLLKVFFLYVILSLIVFMILYKKKKSPQNQLLLLSATSLFNRDDYMILQKSKKINTFLYKTPKKCDKQSKINRIKKFIREYENNINIEYITCSNCDSDKLIGYGYYSRNIVLFDQNLTIKIRRVKCKECGHTHAIIPTFIKPYFQFESSFIDYIVKHLTINKCSKNELAKLYSISRQIIRKWQIRFEKFYYLLLTTFNSEGFNNIYKKVFDDSFISIFYTYNQKYYFLKDPPT